MISNPKICIIGTGNVSCHLERAFQEKATVSIIEPHNLTGLPNDYDLYIIAVSDKAIGEVAAKLNVGSALVAHTSGTTPISILSERFTNAGVLYPFQTFTKDSEIDYSQIPFFIEGSTEEATERLKFIAGLISNKVYTISGETRESIHLAGVITNNFINHLLCRVYDLLANQEIPADVLKPLLRTTFEKAFTLSHPAYGQTGPAVRNDLITISKHLNKLQNYPELAKIYSILTESIINYHTHEWHKL